VGDVSASIRYCRCRGHDTRCRPWRAACGRARRRGAGRSELRPPPGGRGPHDLLIPLLVLLLVISAVKVWQHW